MMVVGSADIEYVELAVSDAEQRQITGIGIPDFLPGAKNAGLADFFHCVCFPSLSASGVDAEIG